MCYATPSCTPHLIKPCQLCCSCLECTACLVHPSMVVHPPQQWNLQHKQQQKVRYLVSSHCCGNSDSMQPNESCCLFIEAVLVRLHANSGDQIPGKILTMHAPQVVHLTFLELPKQQTLLAMTSFESLSSMKACQISTRDLMTSLIKACSAGGPQVPPSVSQTPMRHASLSLACRSAVTYAFLWQQYAYWNSRMGAAYSMVLHTAYSIKYGLSAES